jgi:hypothetical protein
VQIVLESASLDAAFVPPSPENPEGAVLIVAKEGYISIPLSVPRLTAVGLAQRILQVCAAAAGNGGEDARVFGGAMAEAVLPAPPAAP